METFGMMISLLMPFGTLAIVIFAIAAIMEGKTNMKKASIIRSLYFYLASVITLVIVTGSVIYMVNMGLKTWVFTNADPGVSSRLGPPPSLYFNDNTVLPPGGSVKAVPTTAVALTCQDNCTLTDIQKTDISSWKTSYQSWKDAVANPGSQRARDAVVALSFLIVALPFYIIHFRIVQRDARVQSGEEKERSVIRPTYFYFVALGSLIMMVVAGGFLINLALKTWVFPSAGQADKVAEKVLSAPVSATPEGDPIRSIVSCGEKCGLDAETITLAKGWTADYNTWQKEVSHSTNNTQRQAATSIPFVLAGIPLFWYHWSVVRRESREHKEKETEANASG